MELPNRQDSLQWLSVDFQNNDYTYTTPKISELLNKQETLIKLLN